MRFPVAECRLPIPEIKNSLCLPAFGGYGSLDLGELCQLRPWKGSSFEFGRARSLVRIGMVRGKRTPLRLGNVQGIFAAIYYKRSHLARGRRSARSRRDLPLSRLERLQLRVLLHAYLPFRRTSQGCHRGLGWCGLLPGTPRRRSSPLRIGIQLGKSIPFRQRFWCYLFIK